MSIDSKIKQNNSLNILQKTAGWRIFCVCTSSVDPSLPLLNQKPSWCHWDVPFSILMELLPRGCVLLLNLHFLCGILNCSAAAQSPTHIIIHLFPGYSRGIYQRDMEGSIYQRIHHVHQENPVTRKAHKNKKALITSLAQSEWMDCFH